MSSSFSYFYCYCCCCCCCWCCCCWCWCWCWCWLFLFTLFYSFALSISLSRPLVTLSSFRPLSHSLSLSIINSFLRSLSLFRPLVALSLSLLLSSHALTLSLTLLSLLFYWLTHSLCESVTCNRNDTIDRLVRDIYFLAMIVNHCDERWLNFFYAVDEYSIDFFPFTIGNASDVSSSRHSCSSHIESFHIGFISSYFIVICLSCFISPSIFTIVDIIVVSSRQDGRRTSLSTSCLVNGIE